MQASVVTAAALVLLQLAAASAAPIGLPGCNTTCGHVIVPYPFGFQHGCYRPGFNLTCDTSYNPPRLLLGDGSLRVVNIYPQNSTIRVLRDGSMVNLTGATSDGLNVPFAPIFAGGHYRMSYNNELILFGCDVMAALVAGKIRPVGEDGSPMAARCASFCGGSSFFGGRDHYCSSAGCCQASYVATDWYRMPTELRLRPLESWNNSDQQGTSRVSVFLAEKGWLDNGDWQNNEQLEIEPTKKDIPVILRWDIMQGLALSESDEKRDPYEFKECAHDVASLCKSNKSECTWDIEVYQCKCKEGYDGNPYVDGGCQDIDECKHPQDNGCFGDCTNTEGSFECRCPSGTFGDATVRDGCVKTADSPTPPDVLGMAPARIGLPDCNTTCGNVHVPYPFGFGPSRCYLPGFDLTCDNSHNPPRLLLGGGNSTLQIVRIFLNDSTVRVIHATTFDVTKSMDRKAFDSRGVRYVDDDKQVGVRFPDIGEPYMLSARNELILTGCNVEATLHTGTGDSIVSCVSNCTSSVIVGNTPHTGNKYCTGRDGCCHVRIPPGSRPKNIKFKQLVNPNMSQYSFMPPLAFVTEEGQVDQWYMIFNRSIASYLIRNDSWTRDLSAVRRYTASQVPLLLRWVVKQNVPTSAQSYCRRENGGYTCQCSKGFLGNPYIIDGCQDIDECKIQRVRNACFGDCKNLYGSYECQCPQGTHGDPYKPGGCINPLKGLTIGLSAAAGPAFLFLVLGVRLAFRKVKKHRKMLRLKYLRQNRGQLLQQLVSQRADIAERMVITADELAKATNNFDKAQELGGGGHGTVYKGPRSLSWRNRLRIAKEIAGAIAYLHSSVSVPIIHRDIKSSNILLDDALIAKVSDFGASRSP
ncbi:hypothetical protein QOZ80_6BG0481050 [Eleusine coracana subsp. coracana]|nr:hypothetical protein QOZ80_6BG0481050 [Eleusine coracana subsp. coracana]